MPAFVQLMVIAFMALTSSPLHAARYRVGALECEVFLRAQVRVAGNSLRRATFQWLRFKIGPTTSRARPPGSPVLRLLGSIRASGTALRRLALFVLLVLRLGLRSTAR